MREFDDMYYQEDGTLEPEVVNSWNDDHYCFAFRHYALIEGNDCIYELCSRCGRIRYEHDGKRALSWFSDKDNPTGMKYAYPDPVKGTTLWKWFDD